MSLELQYLNRVFTDNDYESFNKLFDKYYVYLCKIVFTILEDKSGSEDVVQELFIKIWNNRKMLSGEIVNQRDYLIAAAKNAALNHLRSVKNRKRIVDSLDVDNESVDSCLLEDKELQILLNQCIDKLPQRCKEVFELSRFEELKQKDISEKLGTSIKTIKNQIWKALSFLKQCLNDNGINVPLR
jgi:RNA polymerase sigma-70 factor (ECF subfamily)